MWQATQRGPRLTVAILMNEASMSEHDTVWVH